jgi:RNA polymerase sigma-70 factor (ECF subfamily)
VTPLTDGGGKVQQALKPVTGPQTVARWFAALGTQTYQGIDFGQMKAELTWINAGPGIVFRGPDRVIATLTFDFDPQGRITTIHNVANPDKLHAVTDGIRHQLT